MQTPINWLAGIVLLGVVIVLCGALVTFVAVSKAYRRITWGREWKRRRALPRGHATVEASERLTEAGHFDLVISFAPDAGANYRGGSGRKLRGVAQLPPEAARYLDSTRTLPIRFDPQTESYVVLDLEELLGERAEEFERNAYVSRGRSKWKVR
jgi:hypothetical protein